VIYTDRHDVNADRLRSGFDSINLAEKLHKKTNELLTQITYKETAESNKASRKQTIDECLKKEFGPNINISNHSYVSGGHYTETENRGFTKDNIKVITGDGKSFSAKVSLSQITAEQVRQVMALVASMKTN